MPSPLLLFTHISATEMEKSVEVTQQPPQQDEEEQEGEEVTAETPKVRSVLFMRFQDPATEAIQPLEPMLKTCDGQL